VQIKGFFFFVFPLGLCARDSLPEDYKTTLQKDKPIHNNTQNYTQTENPDLDPVSRLKWTGGYSYLVRFKSILVSARSLGSEL
jgi:hypothetical protein